MKMEKLQIICRYLRAVTWLRSNVTGNLDAVTRYTQMQKLGSLGSITSSSNCKLLLILNMNISIIF